MKISRIGIGGLALALGCAMLGPAAPVQAGTQTAEATNGCSNGAFCLYTEGGYRNGNPEQYWTNYGCYNLQNKLGQRYAFNNQYGGKTATLWTGANCTGSPTHISSRRTWKGNITPINSISVNNS